LVRLFSFFPLLALGVEVLYPLVEQSQLLGRQNGAYAIARVLAYGLELRAVLFSQFLALLLAIAEYLYDLRALWLIQLQDARQLVGDVGGRRGRGRGRLMRQ